MAYPQNTSDDRDPKTVDFIKLDKEEAIGAILDLAENNPRLKVALQDYRRAKLAEVAGAIKIEEALEAMGCKGADGFIADAILNDDEDDLNAALEGQEGPTQVRTR